ncbi:MAG: hypothetical protein WJU30_00574 [Candidatus Phytoplasma pruni]
MSILWLFKKNFIPLKRNYKLFVQKKERTHYKDIQKKFGIKNVRQINRWYEWFNNNQSYRLQQKKVILILYPKEFNIKLILP